MITSVDEFVRLCESEVADESRRIKTDETPEGVLLGVLHEHPELSDCVVRSNSVTVRILSMLADDPDIPLRRLVAMKRKLSLELFERLSRDEDPVVRQTIALNRKSPDHILHALAQDDDEFVAEAARRRLSAKR